MGDRESIGGEIAVGYLTSETLLTDPARYQAQPGAQLHADAEAAVRLQRDLPYPAEPRAALEAIGRYGLALELVDLAPAEGEPESLVIANVFHRAVRLGELPAAPRDPTVTLRVGDEVKASGTWTQDLGERLVSAARVLDGVGECLRSGDWIITGAIEQIPIKMGDLVAAQVEQTSIEVRVIDTASDVRSTGG